MTLHEKVNREFHGRKIYHETKIVKIEGKRAPAILTANLS
jgi:hypothetical protein